MIPKQKQSRLGTGGLKMRLTDRKTAEAVKANAQKLQAAGFEAAISDLIYIKLAEYENEEEIKEKRLVNYDPDEWYE